MVRSTASNYIFVIICGLQTISTMLPHKVESVLKFL